MSTQTDLVSISTFSLKIKSKDSENDLIFIEK